MRKYLLHVLIISFIFLVPTIIHSAEEEKDRLLVVPLTAQKGIDQKDAILLTPTVPAASYAGEIEDAKEEVRNNPDDAKAHYNLGVVYGESGMYQEAIESFKQVIRIDPDNANTHYNLGLAYYNLGWNKAAIKSFKQAIKIQSYS